MSVYRVIDVIGTSTQSWEDAAVTAVSTARKAPASSRIGSAWCATGSPEKMPSAASPMAHSELAMPRRTIGSAE